jgi:ubiquinone/menaquinone biosynthesis C-methylase UbiE
MKSGARLRGLRNDSTPDRLNLAGYSKPAVARRYGDHEGYRDQGERIVFEALAGEMDNKTILDIGVGAGRTVPLLRAISEDYTAIDFSREMVRLCRQHHPGVKVDVGDARDLGRFATGSTDLVVFSFGGIDHVTHDDRQAILGEVHRVLKPGGAFAFSTHNKHGPGHGEKPWGRRRDLTQPGHMARLALWFPVHLRYRKLDIESAGWSMRNCMHEHFSMVFHYSTVSNQLEALAAAGFRPGEDTDSWLFHVLARR